MYDRKAHANGEAASLREQAAAFRKLAGEHHAAGNTLIAAKLLEVAAELEAKANGSNQSASGPLTPRARDQQPPEDNP
jgi:hypothetical protein